MKTIGQRVRERRLALKMNQTELAEGICTPSAISQLESDKFYPSTRIINGLAKKLQLTPNDLLVCAGANLDTKVLVKMADFYQKNHQFDECLTVLQKLEKRDELTDAEKKQVQLIKSVVLFHKEDEPTKAIKAVYQLLDQIDHREGYERLTAEAYNKLGLYQLKVPSFRGAYAAYYKGRNVAKKLGERDELYAKLCYNLGMVCNYLGKVNSSVKYLAEAVDLYSRFNNIKYLAQSLFDLGIASYERGELEESEKHLQNAIALLEASDSLVLANRAREYHAYNFVAKESLEAAIEVLSDCAKDAMLLSDRSSLGYYHARIANLCILQKDIFRAEAHVHDALSFFEVQDVSGDYAYVLRVVGLVYLFKNDLDNGVANCLKSAELFDKIDLLADSIQSLQFVAEAYRDREMYLEATETYEEIMRKTAERRFGVKL